MKLPIRRNIQVNSSLCEKQQNEPEKPLSSSSSDFRAPVSKPKHVCPHKTANADDNDDRNSKFPMLSVDDALNKIFASISKISEPIELLSPMNCPPFRASIKVGTKDFTQFQSAKAFLISLRMAMLLSLVRNPRNEKSLATSLLATKLFAMSFSMTSVIRLTLEHLCLYMLMQLYK